MAGVPKNDAPLGEPEFYKGADGKIWWRLVALNGEVEQSSHQGFADKRGAERNLARGAGRLLASLRHHDTNGAAKPAKKAAAKRPAKKAAAKAR